MIVIPHKLYIKNITFHIERILADMIFSDSVSDHCTFTPTENGYTTPLIIEYSIIRPNNQTTLCLKYQFDFTLI